MSIVTLTTDFGAGGRYVAQMKGVLYARRPGVVVVDLSHELPPQDVARGARFLEEVTPWWPDGSVHLVVIDPGVGTERPIVAIDALGQRFVGPDNGLFGWLTDRAEGIVAIDSDRVGPAGESATFHGRDLMAPAAALLAGGAKLSDLGEPHPELCRLAADAEPDVDTDRVGGRIVEVDRYGNLITNVSKETLVVAPHDTRLRVTLGSHETLGLWRTYGEHPPGTLIALVGSTGFVELAIVNGNAAEMLFAREGDTVTFDWLDEE